MFQNLTDGIINIKLLGINPDALGHQERVIADLTCCLNFKTVQKLTDDQIHHIIQLLIKYLEITVGLNAQTGKIDGGKTQITPTESDLSVRIIMIAQNSGTTAHVSNFCIRIAFFIVSKVKRCINETEIRKQSLGGSCDSQLEQIIIRIVHIVIDPFFYLENLHRENRSFACPQSVHGGIQKIAYDHTAFRRGVCSIINGRERHLGSGSGMHGIQIMNQ